MSFISSGGVIDALTGGKLKALVSMIFADPLAIQQYANELTDLSGLIEGPKQDVARVRDRLANVWHSETGRLTVRDLDVLNACLSDTKAAMFDFANSILESGNEIKTAQDKCKRIIDIGSAVATAQLAIPLFGPEMALMTALGVIAGVGVVIFTLMSKLNGIAESMATAATARANGITSNAQKVVENYRAVGQPSTVRTTKATAGRTPTVFDYS